jgi:hypothetical protein
MDHPSPTAAEQADSRIKRALSVFEESERRLVLVTARFEQATNAMSAEIVRLRRQVEAIQRQHDLLAQALKGLQ